MVYTSHEALESIDLNKLNKKNKNQLIELINDLVESTSRLLGQRNMSNNTIFGTTSESVVRKSPKLNNEKQNKGGRKQNSKNFSSEVIEAFNNDNNIKEYKGVPVKVVNLPCDEFDKEKYDATKWESEKTVKVTYVPGHYEYVLYVKEKYKLMNKNTSETSIISTSLDDPMEKSFLSASATINLVIMKFLYGVPPYRLLNEYINLGIKIDYDMLINVVMKFGKKLAPLVEKLNEIPFTNNPEKTIYIDETTHTVLDSIINEKGKKAKKNYVYVMVTSKVKIYKFTGDRKSQWFIDNLTNYGYDGYVITDDFAGYKCINKLQDIKGRQLCACHARRRFFRAYASLSSKLKDDENGVAYVGCILFDEIFKLEDKTEGMSNEKIVEYRNSPPYLEAIANLKNHIEKVDKPLPGSYLEDAINYTKSNWDELWVYLKDGNVRMTNSLAENGVKKLAMIRNSSLLFKNKDTAQINCNLLTIVQTAVMHQKDITRYLSYVIHYIGAVNIDDLLPWSDNLYTMPEDFIV